jgi:aspartate kinase
MITTSEVAVSVTIDNKSNLKEILKELEPFGSISIESEHSIISVVGNEITQTPEILKRLFESLAGINIRMVSYGGSRHNISLLVPSSDKIRTLQLLNKGLFGLE